MILFHLKSTQSIFYALFYNLKKKEFSSFELSDEHNNIVEMKEYIKSNKNKLLIGFNVLEYTYPLLHSVVNGHLDTSSEIKWISDEIYNTENRWENIIPKSNSIFKILDLYKLHHFNKDGGRVGIKDVQIKHQIEDISEPISYNEDNYLEKIRNSLKSELKAIYRLFVNSKKDIRLREDISKQIKFNTRSHDLPRLGESIFLKFIQMETGIKRNELVSKATTSTFVDLGDCMFDIEFRTPQFDAIKRFLQRQVVDVSKKKELENIDIKDSEEINKFSIKDKGKIKKLNIVFDEMRINMGLGGLHASINPGVYEASADDIILDDDAEAFYPSIAITNGLYPEHIDQKLFCGIYEDIFKARKKFTKGSSEFEALKRCIVSVFGKTKAKGSPFYDPKMFLTGTINGQLMLLKYIEWLKTIEGFKLLQINTDGVLYQIPKKGAKIALHLRNKWINQFGIMMKSKEVDKIAISDVNNVLCKYSDEEIKAIGLFEYDKDYHKSQSNLIVPIALNEYFLNNTPIEDTVKSHRNIFDFCLTHKFKRGSHGELHRIDGQDVIIDNLQKINRYIITKKGSSLIKVNEKNKKDLITRENITVVNNISDVSFNDINYQYYIKEANKIRNKIVQQKFKFILR